MSGVFGYCDDGRAEHQALAIVDRMAGRMRHQAYFVVRTAAVEPAVALGHLGLGIINAIPQPIRSRDGRTWLCLAGEFYHQEDRRRELIRTGCLVPDGDDAALAMAVYEQEGADGLSRLEGMFLVALWDGHVRELILVNDRFGLYPHYFAQSGGCFAFAPEIKGVLAAPHVARNLDPVALSEYVSLQQLLGDRTWFESVRLLRPATILRFQTSDGRLSAARYWDWDRIETHPSPDFVEQYQHLLERAVRVRTSPDLSTGIYLTGGLDSRTLVAFVERPRSIATLTFGEAGSRDVVYAKRVARLARTRHYWFPFRDGRWVEEHAPLHLTLTEGLHSWIHSHGMSTLQTARSIIDVNLTGWRAGFRFVPERWLGWPRDQAIENDDALVDQLYGAFGALATWPGLTEAEAGAVLRSVPPGRARPLAFDSFREELARTAHNPAGRVADHFWAEQHNGRSTIQHVVFMRSAFEVRIPFYDYQMMNLTYGRTRESGTTYDLRRRVLTRRSPLLALVPYDFDGLIPHTSRSIRLLSRGLRKSRKLFNEWIWPLFQDRPSLYADYERYLRTDLRAWAEGILFSPRTEARGLFDAGAVRALWDRHLGGRELLTIGKIAPLITIELMLRDLYD